MSIAIELFGGAADDCRFRIPTYTHLVVVPVDGGPVDPPFAGHRYRHDPDDTIQPGRPLRFVYVDTQEVAAFIPDAPAARDQGDQQ